MSFVVWVEHTYNGRLGRSRLAGVPEETRAKVEDLVKSFHAGQRPMERVLSFNESDGKVSGLRWIDIKNIWIENN